MRALFTFLVVLVGFQSFSQAPIVQKVDPLVTFPNDTVIITGNGFSATESDLQVWFGPVKGTILESTEFSIRVIVPPQASTSNIEVMNLATRQSGRSLEKFMPSYSGSGFNVSNFGTPLIFSHDEELWDLCTCDLNGDNKPDIASTKFQRPGTPFANALDLVILRNTSTAGSISFTEQTVTLNIATDHVICGDLQGDGKQDLIITRSGSPRNEVWILRNTTTDVNNVTFATPIKLFIPATELATRLALFDLNRDGKSDIVVTNSNSGAKDAPTDPAFASMYVFPNSSSAGTLTFNQNDSLRIKISGLTNTYETSIQDFDNDGLPDVLFGRFQDSDLYILRNTSTGTMSFAKPFKITVPGSFNRFFTYDLNKDNKQDLIVTSTSNDKMEVLTNQSTPGNFSFGTPIEFAASDGPWGIDGNDIDGDKDVDFAVANRDVAKIDVFLNNGGSTPSFTTQVLTTGDRTRNVRIEDFDGDGRPDLAYTSFDDILGSATSAIEIVRSKNCHLPVIQNDQPLTACAGQTIKLQTIPANNVTYTWKEDGSTVGTNSPVLSIVGGGTGTKNYTVTATNASDGCTVASIAFPVTFNTGGAPAQPALNTNAPLCSGEQLTLSTNTVASASYIWTGPNGFTSTTATPSLNLTVDADDAGEYGLKVKVGSCTSNMKTVTVGVVDFADFKINSNNSAALICSGTTVTLSVNDLDNHSFVWYKNGSPISPAQTNASVNVSTTGNYHVVISHDVLGCSRPIDPVTLTYVSIPTAAFTVDDGCVGEELSFNNQSTTDAGATPVYAWTFGDGQTSTEQTPVHAYTAAGTLTAKLKVSYQGVTGCLSNEASDAVTIINAILPVITSSKLTACAEEEVTLSVGSAFSSITWNTTQTANEISVAPGSYSVATVDANGCPGEDDITIESFPIPVLTVSASNDHIGAGSSTQLTTTPADLFGYAWTPALGLSNASISNPIATPPSTTVYVVQGTDANGCTGTAEITITVDGIQGFPAAFSPNGDGENETWNIKAESMPECMLTVFDGRGRRVFEKKGENWDGNFGGKAVPDGTYYYVFSCPGQKPVTGTVLVFR